MEPEKLTEQFFSVVSNHQTFSLSLYAPYVASILSDEYI